MFSIITALCLLITTNHLDQPSFSIKGPVELPALGEITDAIESATVQPRYYEILGSNGWVSISVDSLAQKGEIVKLQTVPTGDSAGWAPNRWIRFRGHDEPMIIKDAGLGFSAPRSLYLFERSGKLFAKHPLPFSKQNSYCGKIEALVWDRRGPIDDVLVIGTCSTEALRVNLAGEVHRSTVPKFNLPDAQTMMVVDGAPLYIYGSKGNIAVVRPTGEVLGEIKVSPDSRYVNGLEPASSQPPAVLARTVGADRRTMTWYLVPLESVLKPQKEHVDGKPATLTTKIPNDPPDGIWTTQFSIGGIDYDVRMQDAFISDPGAAGTNRALDLTVSNRKGEVCWEHRFSGATGIGRAGRVIGTGKVIAVPRNQQEVSLLVGWGQMLWSVDVRGETIDSAKSDPQTPALK